MTLLINIDAHSVSDLQQNPFTLKPRISREIDVEDF